MSFSEWQLFIKGLAKSKNLDLKLILNALVSCGEPCSNRKLTVIIIIRFKGRESYSEKFNYWHRNKNTFVFKQILEARKKGSLLF